MKAMNWIHDQMMRHIVCLSQQCSQQSSGLESKGIRCTGTNPTWPFCFAAHLKLTVYWTEVQWLKSIVIFFNYCTAVPKRKVKYFDNSTPTFETQVNHYITA